MLVNVQDFIPTLAYFDMKSKGKGNKTQSRDVHFTTIYILPSYDGS